VAAAADVADALAPHLDRDWSVRAGPLRWDVEATVVHLIGAPAKYTLYLASRSPTFIALAVEKFSGATHAELHASIRPVAEGLATVARSVPPSVRAFHAAGPTDAAGFLAMACVELLVHADDALRGLDDRLHPPADLAGEVLRARYPAARGARSWPALIAATGRLV